MGRERDYDGEYEQERNKQYKKEVSWSGLAKEDRVYSFKLTPAPPGYYLKRQVTKNSLEMMEGYKGAAIKPQFYSLDDRAESPRQNQQKQGNPTRGQRKPDKQQSPQTQKLPYWFQRIFGGGKHKPKQPGVRDRGNVKNRTPRSHRSGKPKDTPAVAGFKQKLKTSAHTELDKNQQQLDGLREQYLAGSHSKQSLDNLREEVTLLARYEEKEQEILDELSWVSNDPGAAALNSQAYDPEAFERLQNELVEVKQARAALLKQFPVAGLLRTEQVDSELVSDRRLVQISRKFNGIERDIQQSRFGIDNGDIPLSELDGIIPGVLEQIPEEQRSQVEAYIKKKKQTEATVQAGTAGAEVLLTLFGVFSGGGVLSSIYYGVAGALGLGTAAYEFERAADLNTVANAGNAGGTQLLSDPEQAKRNYVFAWANLTLGLVDSGLAITEGGQLLKGAKAAEKLATRPNSQAIFNLPSDDVLAIQRAVDLERAGDPAAQQTLAALKQKLGSDFDAVYDTLKDRNLRVVDDAETAKIKGRGLSSLTPEQEAVADRLGNEFAQTIVGKGDQVRYKKDKIDYVKRRLTSGRLVEEIGESKVRDFYSNPNAEVWSNVYLQARDANGKNIGGKQAELDFFVHYPDKSSSSEIVSAKLDGKKAKPKIDREHLGQYYDINIDSPEELRSELNNRFGGKKSPYGKFETDIVVKYTDVKTGKTGETTLREFRKKISKPPTDAETGRLTTTVRVLAPDDTKLKEGRDIKLGVNREVLFNKITSVIDNNL